MIIGFKGKNEKLKSLYANLGLVEKSIDTFEDFDEFIKKGEKNVVVVNFNDLMVYDNATADIVEKKNKILKSIKSCKKNLFLGLSKNDTSHDKLKIDVAISTKVETDDIEKIKEYYDFLNTDLAFNGKLKDDEYAVKKCEDYRALPKTLDDIKKIIM